MRKLTIGLLAAAGIACAAAPASAEGFYFGAGPGGFAVGVGGPGYYEPYYASRYHWGAPAYEPSYAYNSGYRWGGPVYNEAYAYEPGFVQTRYMEPAYARSSCRTTLVRNQWGEVRRIRRCW